MRHHPLPLKPAALLAGAMAITGTSMAGVTSYRSAVATEPSRVAYFPIDGSLGPAIANTVVPAHGGTLEPGAELSTAAGRTIGSHSIVQTGAGRLALDKDPAWDFADGSGTVEAVMFQTASAAYNPCFFSVREDGGAGVRYSLHGDPNGANLYLWNGAAVSIWPVAPSMINRLCHVVLAFESGNVTAYLNGVSLGTKARALGAAVAAPAQIGASGPGGAEAWPGHLDEVALYAEALPAAAVAAHYQAWLSNDTGTAPTLTSQPASVTRAPGQPAAFSVSLASAAGASFRWQRNGRDIAGATAASYTLPAVSLADTGAHFRCILYNAFGGAVSESATLTVADLQPPSLLRAEAPYSAASLILTFDEPVDPAAAVFTVAGATVTRVATGALPNTLVLTLAGLPPQTASSVTTTRAMDAAGNVMPVSTLDFVAAPAPAAAPIELLRPGREPAGPASRRGGLVISEINYHPADRADFKNLEFIEISNTLPWPEDLGGYRLSGEVGYEFPAGTLIPAGGQVVVAAVPADVAGAHSLAGVLGPYAGALNNSGGTVRLRDYSNAVVIEVDFDSDHPWHPAADGAGHSLVLARPSQGMKNPLAWDPSTNLGGSPGAADPAPSDPDRTVLLNEVSAASTGSEFIELFNYSTAAVDVSGCSLSDDRTAAKFVLPAGTSLAPGGHLSLHQTVLGFALKAGGDTVYFRAPGTGDAPGRVLDCLRFGPQAPGATFGRHPDGAAAVSALRDATPGGPNEPPAAAAAVISEILYNPPTGSTQPPFVEIANASGALLDLSGWRLSGGVRHVFPPGTLLPADGQLAVTAFSGSLNRGTGERLRLEKPLVDDDGGVPCTVHTIVDEVTYGTGGRWGRDSDGGGSSLEKRDLLSDGRLAANWADSTEAAESAWVTLSHTGILDHGQPGTPANRLEVMLLGAGEVLIDNVELVQGAGPNTVTNPGFENGQTGWSADGTHAGSAVSAGTGVGGSSAMHLRATGRGDLAGNRLFNRLTATAATGTMRTLRAQVKYLRGHPEILFRLHGGWLETTGQVLGPVVPGTPGAVNSRAAATATAGPAISGVTHRPVLPPAGQAVTVYAQIADREGLAAAVLRYRLDPATTATSVMMQPRGAGLYSADIPGQASGKLAAFSLTAAGSTGATSTFPAGAPAAEGLVRWGESQPAGNSFPSYRLWFTQATAAAWASRLKNSNAPLDATFVVGDHRIIYNAGAMYSGSPFHTPAFNSPTGNPCDYTVTVPSDDRHLGATDMVWAGPGTFGSDTTQIREQTAWWIARKIGVPALHRRFVNVIVNGLRRGQIMEDTQQPNGDFLDEHFTEDSGGALYKAQDWIEYNDDGAGFQQLSRAVLARARSGGQHKLSTYRYRWSARSVASGNDYAAFTGLVDAFNAGANAADPAFASALDPILDQDSWSRALAVQRIIGNWDTWGWSYGKNMYAYKPQNGPWAMIPWDLDFGFGPDGSSNPAPDTATAGLFQNASNFDPGAPGDALATKFRTQPAFRRAYWCALLDAAHGPMAPATAHARIDTLVAALRAGGLTVNASQLASVKTYITNRRNYIIAQANTVYGTTTFALTGPPEIVDDDGLLTLAGTAPPTVKTLRLNGVDYTPSWTSQTAWSLPLALYAQVNRLVVEGLDLHGAVIGSFPVSVTVTSPPPLPPVTLNEWMANPVAGAGLADPADGDFDDWFELFNAGAAAVNLGGFLLSDDPAVPGKFQIPDGTVIPAGGHLLVWADEEPTQQGLIPGHLHAPFRLSAAGESLVLSSPNGTVIDTILFGPQAAGQSQGRHPDGAARLVLPVPTPGRRNALAPQALALIDAGGAAVEFTYSTEPGYLYQLETSADLAAWLPWGDAVTATAAATTAALPRAEPVRYWRARLTIP